MTRRSSALMGMLMALIPLITLAVDKDLAPVRPAAAGSPLWPIENAARNSRLTPPGFDRVQAPTPPNNAPVMFIENVGQFPTGARFQVRGGLGSNMWLGDDAIWVTLLEPATEIPDLRDPTDLRDVLSEPQPRQGVNLKPMGGVGKWGNGKIGLVGKE